MLFIDVDPRAYSALNPGEVSVIEYCYDIIAGSSAMQVSSLAEPSIFDIEERAEMTSILDGNHAPEASPSGSDIMLAQLAHSEDDLARLDRLAEIHDITDFFEHLPPTLDGWDFDVMF